MWALQGDWAGRQGAFLGLGLGASCQCLGGKMWGGLVVSLRSGPPRSTYPGLCPLTSGFQHLCLLPPHLSPYQGPALATFQTRPWPSLGPCTPQRSLPTPLRVTPGSFLGSGVLLASFAAQSHLQPSSTGAGPLLLACTKPSQPARRLPGPHSRTSRGL